MGKRAEAHLALLPAKRHILPYCRPSVHSQDKTTSAQRPQAHTRLGRSSAQEQNDALLKALQRATAVRPTEQPWEVPLGHAPSVPISPDPHPGSWDSVCQGREERKGLRGRLSGQSGEPTAPSSARLRTAHSSSLCQVQTGLPPHYCPHLRDEVAEAQRGKATCSQGLSEQV